MIKYYYLFMLITLTFTACKSKEDKAQEVIKAELFKALDDYSSYEPIETKVDSFFTSIYDDPRISDWGTMFGIMLRNAEESSELLKRAEVDKKIWQGSSTLFGLNKYTDAHRECNRIKEEGQSFFKIMGDLSDSIKARKEELILNEFIGWKVNHKFRSKNKDGNFVISDHVYIFDKEIKNIVDEYDQQDIDQAKSKVLIDMALRYKFQN